MIKVSLHITDMLSKVRRALASHYLFDNWLSMLIKYALIKIGFNVKFTAKVDNCVFKLSPEIFGYLVNRASHGLITLMLILPMSYTTDLVIAPMLSQR